MRLIDADEMFAEFAAHPEWNFGAAEVARMIDNAPTIDAGPVVRCGDCKQFMRYSPLFEPPVVGADGDCWWRIMHSEFPDFCAVKQDDYCSYGKRKEQHHEVD